MYKKHFGTRIILLAIVIAGHGIAAGTVLAAAASTEQPPKTLHEAAKAGKIADVKSFILQGADVNAKDGNGLTALHHAASSGHNEIIEVLLAHGADVNAGMGDSNMTAAEFAMWSDRADIVELLIAKGADVSALHLALHMKDQAKAKGLIEGGADVNKRTQYGTTPLNIAVGHGSVDMAKLLVDHGANVNAKDSDGLTPLHYALWEGHREIAQLLVERGADVHIQDTDGNTTLQQAIKTGKKGRVEKILSTGVIDVSEKDQTGMTPLHLAAQLGHREIADVLLRKGANPNTKDKDGWTPLHKAIIANQKEIAKLLIDKGTDLDIKDNTGRTLHWWIKDTGHDVDVAVTNISVPLNCNQGESVPVTVSIANQGTRRETFRVTLTEESSGQEIASKEVALSKGWEDGSEGVADVVFDAETDEVNFMGGRVCAEGDANADGYNDLIIAASEWNRTQGRVYLYLGGTSVKPSPHRVYTGESVGDHYGDLGATFGDVNNDGYDDIIIPARGYHDNDGRVHIYYGGEDIGSSPDLTLMGEIGQKSWFGLIVSSGDVNGDDYEDVLVTALGYDNWRGRAYLYYGGNPMDTAVDLIFEGEDIGNWFGRKAYIGGDVNGDGYNDLIIGARQYDLYGDVNKDKYNPMKIRTPDTWGRAYLYYGGKPMDAVPDKTFTGKASGDQLSSGVFLSDIDADGLSDVIIGARYAKQGRGAVYIWWGSQDIKGSHPDVVLEGEARSNMGGPLAVGHFNNDNYGDIIAGGNGYNDRRGREYIFYGDIKASIDAVCDLTFTGENKMDRFSGDVSFGDINNDGYDDIIVGAWAYPDDGQRGRAYLYFGPFSNTANITFNWDTTNATPGKHTLKASIVPVAGEEDVADNTMAVTIDVKGISKTVGISRENDQQ